MIAPEQLAAALDRIPRVLGVGIGTLAAAAAVVAATQLGAGTGGDVGRGAAPDFARAAGDAGARPVPTDRRAARCYTTAALRRATVLYRAPGGERRVRLGPHSEWGSPRVLGVVGRRRGWLEVQAPQLRNGETAWIRRSRVRLDCVSWSLRADLSRRELSVRRNGRTLRTLRVAVGRPGNPTPTGRFTVTDRLRVTDAGSPYGCCVLALSGHQANLPAGWTGGDRLAVHATGDESSIGRPASLGCLRAEARQARWLIYNVPLGTPVFIRG